MKAGGIIHKPKDVEIPSYFPVISAIINGTKELVDELFYQFENQFIEIQ